MTEAAGGAPQKKHAHIRSIEVHKSYIHGLHGKFDAKLNCISGGTGTGKSTILELLRFALGVIVLGESKKKHDDIVKTLGNGWVKVTLETRHGMVLTVTRSVGGQPRIRNDKNEVVEMSLDGELFQAEFYGQKEVETIAKNSVRQLALLDKFLAPADARLKEEIESLGKTLATEGELLVRLEKQIADDAERTGELASVGDALKLLQETGGTDGEAVRVALEKRASRTREHMAIEEVLADLTAFRAEAEAFAAVHARKLGREIEPALARGENRAVFEGVSEDLLAAQRAVESHLRGILETTSSARERTIERQRELASAHAAQEATDSAVIAKHDEDRERSAERVRLEQRHAELLGVARRRDERQRERDALRASFDKNLVRRAELAAALTAARKKAGVGIKEKLGKLLEVDVVHAGNTSAYLAFLSGLVEGSGTEQEYLSPIAKLVRPADLATAIEQNDLEPIEEVDPYKDKQGRTRRAENFIRLLRERAHMYDIRAFLVEDQPKIGLFTGEEYELAENVSEGQRCVVILPILLLHAEGPLLIDQPEDHLDNAFVYEVIVKTLLQAKERRQLVFVTHNPNIPILGDAEQVIAMGKRGKLGTIVEEGSAREVYRTIERNMDGGPEAFIGRSRAYGYDLKPRGGT